MKQISCYNIILAIFQVLKSSSILDKFVEYSSVLYLKLNLVIVLGSKQFFLQIAGHFISESHK